MMKFNEVWIPDTPDAHNLSEGLSAFKDFNLSIKPTGVASRLKPLKLDVKHNVMVLLSGSEPQRAVIENKLLNQNNLIIARSGYSTIMDLKFFNSF